MQSFCSRHQIQLKQMAVQPPIRKQNHSPGWVGGGVKAILSTVDRSHKTIFQYEFGKILDVN